MLRIEVGYVSSVYNQVPVPGIFTRNLPTIAVVMITQLRPTSKHTIYLVSQNKKGISSIKDNENVRKDMVRIMSLRNWHHCLLSRRYDACTILLLLTF